MADQKPRLVMDIIAPPPTAEKPTKHKTYLEILIAKLRTVHFHINRKALRALGVLVLFLSVTFVVLAMYPHHQKKIPDLVPISIRRSVPFNVYFPDPAKLPNGYNLDTSSFSASNNAVEYKITHGTNESLIVTVQQKLSDAELQQFYKAHMPLTIPIKTSVGTAALGDLNNETVVSLPTSSNSWLLVTAPLNADQAQLSQVMKAMTLAQ